MQRERKPARAQRGPDSGTVLAPARPATIFGGMDWQQIAALLIVALAAGLLAWGRLRRRRFRFGRDTHCGCSGVEKTAPQSSIIFHARKGEPGRITVKMK